ncbi:MAG: hypothetical protein WC783_00945 [Candidatus Paceibacterota bacterium]
MDNKRDKFDRGLLRFLPKFEEYDAMLLSANDYALFGPSYTKYKIYKEYKRHLIKYLTEAIFKGEFLNICNEVSFFELKINDIEIDEDNPRVFHIFTDIVYKCEDSSNNGHLKYVFKLKDGKLYSWESLSYEFSKQLQWYGTQYKSNKNVRFKPFKRDKHS